ncbi:MAG: DUF447 family protein [Ignisphaera sp.]
MDLEKKIRKMGFSGSTYLEVIAILYRGTEIVNIVPLGFILKKGKLVARIFRGSRTYKLITEGNTDRGRICIAKDATLFYLAIFKKEEALKTFNKLCTAYIDFNIVKVELKRNYANIYGEPVGVKIVDRVPKGFTRASAAVVEALVWLSKIPYVDKRRKAIYENYVKMCVEVIRRSSRSRRYRAIAQDIVKYLQNSTSYLS